MSKLQYSLHAYPHGTFVSQKMLDSYNKDEIERAKAIQEETGCSWFKAISEVLYSKK